MSGLRTTPPGSLLDARDRALAGLPLFGRRRHDAADAIYELYENAKLLRDLAYDLRLSAQQDGHAHIFVGVSEFFALADELRASHGLDYEAKKEAERG